jgi:hypothetical protein
MVQTKTTAIEYSEFEYQPTIIKNEFEIRPYKDSYGEIVVFEDKIATVNSSRFDAEKHAKLLALAPEMLAILLDLRDGDYPLYGEAWMQIDRVIKKAGL